MLKKIPSDAFESFRASELSIQSHAPVRMPAVSTWPGQLPTLKWKPVFNNGPAGDDTNSTNICCDVPALMNNCYRCKLTSFLSLFVSIFHLNSSMNRFRESSFENGKKISEKKETKATLRFIHTYIKTLTNNAVWKLANTTKFTNQWCMLISAIINGQPIERTMSWARSNFAHWTSHNIFASMIPQQIRKYGI